MSEMISFVENHFCNVMQDLLFCSFTFAWCDVEVVGKVLVCFGQTLITCHFHGIFFSSHKREESVEKSSAIPPSILLQTKLSQKWKRFIANCERNWNVKAAAMLESPKNRALWFSNAAIGVVPWIWIGPAEHRNQHSIVIVVIRYRALHQYS